MPSAFDIEEGMTTAQRMKRWDDFVTEASKRFGVPQAWIRAVIMAESGGRTMLGENQPIVSHAGAMGLMQLMPSTYADMRAQHGLGADPFDPHDNILAGTAYLRFLKDKYGYPAMFAAYNDGPGHLDDRIANAGLLPTETIVYVERITGRLEGRGALVKFTRPNGSPVLLDGAAVRSVRAALPGEYAPGVKSVITDRCGRAGRAREPGRGEGDHPGARRRGAHKDPIGPVVLRARGSKRANGAHHLRVGTLEQAKGRARQERAPCRKAER